MDQRPGLPQTLLDAVRSHPRYRTPLLLSLSVMHKHGQGSGSAQFLDASWPGLLYTLSDPMYFVDAVIRVNTAICINQVFVSNKPRLNFEPV